MAERWLRVELRAERLEWLPPVLAALDPPFRFEAPQERRDLMLGFAQRLTARARSTTSATGAPSPDATWAAPADETQG